MSTRCSRRWRTTSTGPTRGRATGCTATTASAATWARQWAAIDTSAEPLAVSTRADGSVAVEVHQRARDLAGALLSEGRVVHVYRFRDALVARMDVEELVSD